MTIALSRGADHVKKRPEVCRIRIAAVHRLQPKVGTRLACYERDSRNGQNTPRTASLPGRARTDYLACTSSVSLPSS